MPNGLLLAIAHCPNVMVWFDNTDPNLDWVEVIYSQDVTDITTFQVPEPWSGRISTIPLLFLSSIPSISKTEAYPKRTTGDEEIIDFFKNRFGGGQRLWVKDGTKALQQDGEYATYTKFLASVCKRAVELYQREVTPGIDYAITEVIHCKSLKEKEASDALNECADRYLARLIAISEAKVLVILGDLASEGFTKRVSLTYISNRHGKFEFNDRTMMVVFLPHPDSWKKRTFIDLIKPTEWDEIRAYLLRNEQTA